MFKCDAGDRLMYEAYESDRSRGCSIIMGDTIINTSITIGPSYSFSNTNITNTTYIQNQPDLKTVYRRIVK